MKIRTFDIEDGDAVEQLWEELFPGGSSHNEPRRVIRDKLAVQKELFFVAEDNGAIIGTIMSGYDGHRGWLYAVAVKPAFQRKGVGRRLVDHAVSALSNLGCPKVNLQVRSTNADVVDFYTAIGFSIEERISMGKRLSDEWASDASGRAGPTA